MKNFAVRLIALVLVLSVILMPLSALAAERNAAVLTVGNLEMYMGEESISIPVYLQLAGGVDLEGSRGFGSAKVLTDTADALYAIAAVEDGTVKAYLNGMEYGLTIPMEQIAAIVESLLAEAAISPEALIEEMTGSMSPEMQSAIEKLMTATTALATEAPAELTPEALFGLTTEAGTAEETVDLFDVQITAVPTIVTVPSITCAAMMDSVAASSDAAKDFVEAYLELINVIAAESGETMTIEEILEMVSLSLTGKIYTAEEGTRSDLVLTGTVTEGEETFTIDFPITLLSQTDANGVYNAAAIEMNSEGQEILLTFYTDDYTNEGMDYTNFEVAVSIYEEESDVADITITFTLYTSGNEEEGTAYGVDLTVQDSEDAPASIGGYYFAAPAEYSEESDSYSGYLYGYIVDSTTELEASLETNLMLSTVPEGELLIFENSINPLEADEATLEKLGNDAMNVVTQGLMVLMQDPTIAALMGN